MVKYTCCAPRCTWSQLFDVDPPDENPGGYTPFAKCPTCATWDSVHYACDFGGCDKRAVRLKGWGRSCQEHFIELRRARRGR